MGLEMIQCKEGLGSCLEKKKRKKRKRRGDYLKSDGIDDIPKVTSSINISPVQIESFLHPPVNTCLSADLEMAQHDPEMIISQDMDKGMDQNKIHNALKSNDSNQDLHESSSKPIHSLTSSECVEKADDNYVSEVADQLNSFPRCMDTSSMTKHDDHAQVDIISLEVSSMKTYQRKKRVETYRRSKRKLSNSVISNLSIKHGAGSSILVVQDSSVRDTSVQNSNEAPAFGYSEKMLGEVVAEYDTALLVAGGISGGRASDECPGGELESGEQEKKIKMENLKEIINEQSVVQDVDTVKERFDKSTTFYKEDKASASSGSDPSVEKIESENFEIHPKMRDPISSSSQLGAMSDDVSLAVISKDGSQQMLQSAHGAATGNFRKKLLVLDVNGILADIVSYASEGYKPDTIISSKAVFKRPFCDDFLQFCFERFNVGVWSSRTKRNVKSVLDFLMGKFKCDLLFCWDQSHCTYTGFNTVENRDKPLLLKELKKLWEKHEPDLPWERGEYNELNTLLLDDSPYKALRNPMHTAIFPHSYRYKNVKDNSLGPGGDLRVYLEGLASADNVKKYVELNPFGQRPIRKTNLSWAFYVKVIGTTSSRQEEDANNSSACEQKLAD